MSLLFFPTEVISCHSFHSTHTHTQKLRSWRGGTHRAGVLFFERWGLIYTYIYTYILVLIFFHIYFLFLGGFVFFSHPSVAKLDVHLPLFPFPSIAKVCVFFSQV